MSKKIIYVTLALLILGSSLKCSKFESSGIPGQSPGGSVLTENKLCALYSTDCAPSISIPVSLTKKYYFDSNSGDDTKTCSSFEPCASISKAIQIAESRKLANQPTEFIFSPGSYGDFRWSVPGDFTSPMYWHSRDLNDRAVFNFILIDCTKGNTYCSAKQHFQYLELYRPPHSVSRGGQAVFWANHINNVSLSMSELHNEDLYNGEGINIYGSNFVIENNVVHDVIHAMRYGGRNILVKGNEFYRFPGSSFSMFCGGFAGTTRSGSEISFEYNMVHDHVGDYPNEPGYSGYDEPAELHASVISIRGGGLSVRGNWFWNIKDSVRIQFYDGDCGVENYDLSDVTIEKNVSYGQGGAVFIQTSESPNGKVIVRNNTIISQYVGVSFAKAPSYDGAGSELYNNIVLKANFAGMTNAHYEYYKGAKWKTENNLVRSRGYPSSRKGFDPNNYVINNEFKDETAAKNFVNNELFIKPNYSTYVSELCAPAGNAECDWTPKAGSQICTMGRNGGYVGAIPCE